MARTGVGIFNYVTPGPLLESLMENTNGITWILIDGFFERLKIQNKNVNN